MTAAELIEELRQLPPATIMDFDNFESYEEVGAICARHHSRDGARALISDRCPSCDRDHEFQRIKVGPRFLSRREREAL